MTPPQVNLWFEYTPQKLQYKVMIRVRAGEGFNAKNHIATVYIIDEMMHDSHIDELCDYLGDKIIGAFPELKGWETSVRKQIFFNVVNVYKAHGGIELPSFPTPYGYDTDFVSPGETVGYTKSGPHIQIKNSALEELKKYEFQKFGADGADEISKVARKLPGMDYVSECPVTGCMTTPLHTLVDDSFISIEPKPVRTAYNLFLMIQHLNDLHKWSRDEIADWLDKLHDDGKVDLSFKIEEPAIKE